MDCLHNRLLFVAEFLAQSETNFRFYSRDTILRVLAYFVRQQ